MNVTYAKYLEKKINQKLLEEWAESDPVIELLSKLSIRLMFLERILMKHEKTNEEVKIIKKLK